MGDIQVWGHDFSSLSSKFFFLICSAVFTCWGFGGWIDQAGTLQKTRQEPSTQKVKTLIGFTIPPFGVLSPLLSLLLFWFWFSLFLSLYLPLNSHQILYCQTWQQHSAKPSATAVLAALLAGTDPEALSLVEIPVRCFFRICVFP